MNIIENIRWSDGSMVKLRDLPWGCVTEDPKEAESWKELNNLMYPLLVRGSDQTLSDQYRSTFFDNIDLFIEYFTYRGTELLDNRFSSVDESFCFIRSASRLLALMHDRRKDGYLDGLWLIQNWNLEFLITMIDNVFNRDLGVQWRRSYAILVMNIITTFYEQEEKREKAIEYLDKYIQLFHDGELSNGVIRNSDSVNADDVLFITTSSFLNRSNHMDEDEQKKWILAVIGSLCSSSYYEKLREDVEKQRQLFLDQIQQYNISTAYKLLAKMVSYLRVDHDYKWKDGQVDELFGTLGNLVESSDKSTFEEIRGVFDSVLNCNFIGDRWIDAYPDKTRVFIVSQKSLPKYKKEVLGNHFKSLIDAFYENNFCQDIVSLYQEWFDEEDRIFVEKMHLFELAYSFHACGEVSMAKKFYERDLEENGESVTVLNNLAVIYEDVDRNLDLALSYYQKLHALDSKNEIYTDNVNRVEKMIREREERPKIIEKRYFKGDRNKFYRPIFYHESERDLYRVLVELFPQHVVFPNMSLKTVIDLEKIKSHLDSAHLDYFFKAHVDFAIINTTNYFPSILFEKDSDDHDEEPSKTNSAKKEYIFQVAGLPLIRLRFNKAMPYDQLEEEVKQKTKKWLLSHESEDNEYYREIASQFDLEAFGIFDRSIDLDSLHELLLLQLGEVVYKCIDEVTFEKETGVLIIKAQPSIQPILKLGLSNLERSICEVYPEVNTVNILYVDIS